MNSKERIKAAIRHEETDRVPIDVGSTGVTGINLIAYSNLLKYLNLTDIKPKTFHTWSQIPEISDTILDLFHSDTVTLPRHKMSLGIANERFKEWKYPDGTLCLVPEDYNPNVNDSGDFEWFENGIRIAEAPAEGTHGFTLFHHPLKNASTTKEIDEWFDHYEGNFLARIHVSDEEIKWADGYAKKLIGKTNRAVVSDYFATVLENAQGILGWDTTYMHMIAEPKIASYFFDRLTNEIIVGLKKYLKNIGKYIDVFLVADDLGHQRGPMMKMEDYKKFIYPCHKQIFQTIHDYSEASILFHTCGSIKEYIPTLIDMGVDCLNTIQTDAENMNPNELKSEFGKDITFWGGGVDSHRVLPFGTSKQIYEDVKYRLQILSKDSGYIFSSIHNILGDVPPGNIVAAFSAAFELGNNKDLLNSNSSQMIKLLNESDYWKHPLEYLNKISTD